MKNPVKKLLCTLIAVLVAATSAIAFTGCSGKEKQSGTVSSVAESSDTDSSSKKEESSKADESSKEEESSKAEESSKEEENSKEEEKDSDSVTPDFKEEMDSYEEFFDEYVEFMKKYAESDNPVGLMADYTEFMSKYTDTMKKLEDIDENELSEADASYYIEVMGRINSKLAEVAGS